MADITPMRRNPVPPGSDIYTMGGQPFWIDEEGVAHPLSTPTSPISTKPSEVTPESFRRPSDRGGIVGPGGSHEFKEYKGKGWGLDPKRLLSPPEYPPSPDPQPLELSPESRVFDPEYYPFMSPEAKQMVERKREQEETLEGLRAQVNRNLEALPEEQKPAARKWLAESRAKTAPIAEPTSREGARQRAIREVGFDPRTLDPNEAIETEYRKGLDPLFRQIFPDKKRGELTPKENAHWQEVLGEYRERITEAVKRKREWAWKSIEDAMRQFDAKKRARDEAVKKEEEDRKYEIEQERKDREEARKIEKETRDIAKAQEEEDKLEWVVNRKQGLKRQVTPEKADQLVETGKWKRGRPIGREKPEYEPGQALEKIASAQRAKATFNKTGKIDVIMAKMFPEYTEGQKLSESEINKVNRAYDRLIKHLQGFAPQLSKRDQAIEQLQAVGQQISEANISYVMDQL